MGRPKEVRLKYFPLDVNFFSNRKIKILKSRYGADGIAVYPVSYTHLTLPTKA